MVQVTEKERSFLEKWKTTREKKWTYIILNGIVLWGLPIGVLIYLVQFGFHFDPVRFVIQTLLSSSAGCLLFYWQFAAQDKRFREVYSKELRG